jgi:6-hydroxycyclohex-1-ene-1-carbonyl-CoA dehydrogenase
VTSVPAEIKTWQMVQPWSRNKETGETRPGKLARASLPVPRLEPGEVLVEIAGCGVCHTDLSYFYGGVPTVNRPPLTLGHEISGRIVAGEASWIGKEVIIPAVMPCDNCPVCAAGRGNRCLAQKMPGNSLGIYGGFSSHIPVPVRDLCPVGSRGAVPLECLAAVADAVTTPYQAATRANVQAGDRAVIVGATGGIGTFLVQVAKAFGAETVVGIDLGMAKLERARKYGADLVLCSAGKDANLVRDDFRALCKEHGLPHNYGWKIFEATGNKAGQEISLGLLSFVSKLIWIGFSTDVNEYSLSRLMAFDAEIIGTWGCLPKHYPQALRMVLEGSIQIEPFVELRPMSSIEKTFEEAHAGRLERRVILTPDFD